MAHNAKAHATGLVNHTIVSVKNIPAAIIPVENRHDGNVCADDEELNGKLCYKQCKLLTQNEYPVRTSAWTCCKAHPCRFSNQKMSLKVCGGYDISGDAEGNGCPHAPGVCLEDEEFSLGMCYKKCSILTATALYPQGEYPHRMAAATCCKKKSVTCMMPPFLGAKTNKAFDVGGGKGDGRSSTPGNMHPPLEELTEKLK